MRRPATLRSTIVCSILVAAVGCHQTPPPTTSPAASQRAIPVEPVEAGAVSLKPGDALQVDVWREPDLSGQFQVNNDGILVLPLLGEREVSGISADSLQKQLAADYRKYLVDPVVTISVLRRIAVLGEVREPGLYPVDLTMSLNDALALAGGIGGGGNKDDVRLIREGRVVRNSLEASTMLASTPIQSGDQIVVGQKGWLSRNIWFVSTGIGALTSLLIAVAVR